MVQDFPEGVNSKVLHLSTCLTAVNLAPDAGRRAPRQGRSRKLTGRWAAAPKLLSHHPYKQTVQNGSYTHGVLYCAMVFRGKSQNGPHQIRKTNHYRTRHKPTTFSETNEVIDRYIQFYNHERNQNRSGAADAAPLLLNPDFLYWELFCTVCTIWTGLLFHLSRWPQQKTRKMEQDFLVLPIFCVWWRP